MVVNNSSLKFINEFERVEVILNDDKVKYQFFSICEGHITRCLKKNKENNSIKFQFSLRIILSDDNPIISNEFYIIFIEDKRNKRWIRMEKEIKVEKKVISNKYGHKIVEKYNYNECRFYVCVNDNKNFITAGKHLIYLYRQNVKDDRRNFSFGRFSSYVKEKYNPSGCYITDVSINTNYLPKYKTPMAEERKMTGASIHFGKKDWNIPRGKFPIFIINEPEAFSHWIDSLNIMTAVSHINGFEYKKIERIVSAIASKNQKIQDIIHPYYKISDISELSKSVAFHITDEMLAKSCELAIEKSLMGIKKKPFVEIMADRVMKYGHILNEGVIDVNRIISFAHDRHLDAEIIPKIKTDYNWYVLNEAAELTEKYAESENIEMDFIDKTEYIYKFMKRIDEFENKNYGADRAII